MIVLLRLVFIFFVTFGIDKNEAKNVKRFGGSSWHNPMENNIEEPMLASIAKVDSNLQPISEPFLGLIYNNYNALVQPNLAYYGNEAQKYLTTNFYSRRTGQEDEKEIIYVCDFLKCPSLTHSCESEVHAISEYKTTIRTTTLCLSLTNETLRQTVLSSSDHSSGMFYYENQVTEDEDDSESDEGENMFHCNDLACPSETISCKSTFKAIPEDFTEIEVTTQCLSITHEVLAERTTNSNNPLNDRYYYELKAIDSNVINENEM